MTPQPSWRMRVATAFGRHSRSLWRCIIGASWSMPLRYLTLLGQLAAVAAVTGGSIRLDVPLSTLLAAMSAGVLVGWLASLADRLAVEYCLFPAAKRFFTRTAP